ncbi:MAG: hypothetical protein J0G96_02140 [Flavobacteriia bacterium]|nr:hypothetical protein [Flavobacteriia bacterium]
MMTDLNIAELLEDLNFNRISCRAELLERIDRIYEQAVCEQHLFAIDYLNNFKKVIDL